eukprot:TRINITY_DN31687_c0_g1_i1.p2 TRINITY_DN31687_c0_g1~~TRINITY_DN31687_c0_g1_i1.p2  ORF type:complete len:140 (-),score=14.37 TRINITY_DN31687_c0_g1_i1:491-853(-)
MCIRDSHMTFIRRYIVLENVKDSSSTLSIREHCVLYWSRALPRTFLSAPPSCHLYNQRGTLDSLITHVVFFEASNNPFLVDLILRIQGKQLMAILNERRNQGKSFYAIVGWAIIQVPDID